MSRHFIEKITATFNGRRHRIALGDHLVVLCADGLRIEGELIAHCPEGLHVACDRTDVWVNSEAIAAVARVKNKDGENGNGGGSGGDSFSPVGNGASQRVPKSDRDILLEKVFCNGTK